MARSYNNVACALLLSESERAVVVAALHSQHKAVASDQAAGNERRLIYEVLYALGDLPDDR